MGPNISLLYTGHQTSNTLIFGRQPQNPITPTPPPCQLCPPLSVKCIHFVPNNPELFTILVSQKYNSEVSSETEEKQSFPCEYLLHQKFASSDSETDTKHHYFKTETYTNRNAYQTHGKTIRQVRHSSPVSFLCTL